MGHSIFMGCPCLQTLRAICWHPHSNARASDPGLDRRHDCGADVGKEDTAVQDSQVKRPTDRRN
jgi:hypothetical protein